MSLDVTAGDDVAFAHALLRCGTPEELKQDPTRRLRLTIGLRKQRGRWAVTGSAPDSSPRANGERRSCRRVCCAGGAWWMCFAYRNASAAPTRLRFNGTDECEVFLA